jgi:hypothetical protein
VPNIISVKCTLNSASTKRIYSESDFKEPNLGGCPDWKCEITNDLSKADALINVFPHDKSFNGYLLFSTQVRKNCP